jgi:hypothetical protein
VPPRAAWMAPFENGVMANVVVRLSNNGLVAVVCHRPEDKGPDDKERQRERMQTLFAPADGYGYLPTRLERSGPRVHPLLNARRATTANRKASMYTS